MKYIELFGGIGGFSLGIQKATQGKWKCVGYYEKDKYAVQIYNKNFGTKYKPQDVRKVNADEINECEILCAGFPCQPFSIAGKRLGFEDTQGTHFFEIARIAKERRIPILFLENVKGLLSHDKGRTFATILATLDELGYNAEWQVLNSKYFGVPQNRERVFIIGHLRGTSSRQVFPIRQISKETFSFPTLTQRYTAQRDGGYILHKIKLKTNTKKGYDEATEKMDGIRLQFEDSKTARGRVIKGFSQALQANSTHGVLDKDKVRRFTPIECERLQGFPDGWTEGVSDTQRYKQLGNAVTTNVIEAITKKLNPIS